MKILAVDDDHAVRVSLNVMFRKWSDVVLEVAEEAQSAMEMLSKEEYLMMFCDVDMPDMDGLELLEIVREKYPAMPVVMLTGNQDITTPIKAFQSGAMDYLQKPMRTAVVRETIDKAFEIVEKEEKKRTGISDVEGFKKMVENFSPEKMGLVESGVKTAEFSKLVNMLQEKLIHPSKLGKIHNLFLLTKSGIVISNLTTKDVENSDVDIMGGMFSAVKDFMEDAVSSDDNSSLDDIQFGDFHIKFGKGAYTDLAVVYVGDLDQEAKDEIDDSIFAFEHENAKVLEDWNGDKNLLQNSERCLENLFSKIDRSEDA